MRHPLVPSAVIATVDAEAIGVVSVSVTFVAEP